MCRLFFRPNRRNADGISNVERRTNTGIGICTINDSHDPSQVGDFTFARAMLEEIGFDENLILNNDEEKLKAFLLG